MNLMVLGSPALPWDEVLSPEREGSSDFQSCVTLNWSPVIRMAGEAGEPGGVQSPGTGQLSALRGVASAGSPSCHTYEGCFLSLWPDLDLFTFPFRPSEEQR